MVLYSLLSIYEFHQRNDFTKKGYPFIARWMVYFMENPLQIDDSDATS